MRSGILMNKKIKKIKSYLKAQIKINQKIYVIICGWFVTHRTFNII